MLSILLYEILCFVVRLRIFIFIFFRSIFKQNESRFKQVCSLSKKISYFCLNIWHEFTKIFKAQYKLKFTWCILIQMDLLSMGEWILDHVHESRSLTLKRKMIICLHEPKWPINSYRFFWKSFMFYVYW